MQRNHDEQETMLAVVAQEMIEERYNKRHIDRKIKDAFMANPDLLAKVPEGVALVNAYMAVSYYDSKNARIAQLKELDIEELVFELYVGVAYFIREELLSSVCAQLSSRLHWDDKVAAITTIAELLAVLCETNMFDITKPAKMDSLMVVSNIQFEDSLVEFIENCRYLPPMVCVPLELKDNYSSGYLTHKDGLVLGKGNMHSGDICLDVLNITNQVALRLATDFIGIVEENPTSEFTVDRAIESAAQRGKVMSEATAKTVVRDQIENWKQFKSQSYDTYLTLATNGNKFFLTHKVDKRGRIYSQGYHVNTEGVGHKKACVELFHEELLTGMPS